ncbi:MAG: Fe-S-containing hydro-lyase [Ruminococcaceae bacterium]|nr:Fe-S-containing hydro-lyase [Oscillospiraceae bacterium]
MEIKLHTSEVEKIKNLKAGDMVLLSGVIYTARDAAHKRMTDALAAGEELPLDIKDAIIYYAGPTPPKPGEVIGSCGPTTSYRMDKYAPTLLDEGQLGMIGKGLRNQDVIDAVKRNEGIYFAAIGGAGALISKSIKKAEVIAYEDLGAEALRRLEVEDLSLTVVIDKDGNNLYDRA